MNTQINLQDRILNVNPETFLALALEVFDYQSKNNEVYSDYLHLLNKHELRPKSLVEIPFLPTEIFKHRIIKSGKWIEEIIFESSGTTQLVKSNHFIRSLDWYYQVSSYCFENHYGPMKQFEFIGLLPSSKDKPNSSLVSMFQFFARHSNSSNYKDAFLNDYQALYDTLVSLQNSNKKIVLFGLSFALLDFAAQYIVQTKNLIVIETGGMKSMLREVDKETLLQELKIGFPNASIHSEYGMTELMSQAYAFDGMHYTAAPLLKFLISDPTDPTSFLSSNKRGIVNVIDLGNINTCSFIQTGDLGILDNQQRLNIFGRYSPEEARGCVQMYE